MFFRKKSVNTIIWLAVSAVVVLCALYALGVIGGSGAGYAEGVEYSADGYTYLYTGALLNEKPDGFGEIVYDNGDCYKGGFRSGRFDGEGVYTSASGWRYEGGFAGGRMAGEGRYIYADGSVVSGAWSDGIPVRSDG